MRMRRITVVSCMSFHRTVPPGCSHRLPQKCSLTHASRVSQNNDNDFLSGLSVVLEMQLLKGCKLFICFALSFRPKFGTHFAADFVTPSVYLNDNFFYPLVYCKPPLTAHYVDYPTSPPPERFSIGSVQFSM